MTNTYTIKSTSANSVAVIVGGTTHRLPWDLLVAAAGQADPALRAAYGAMLLDAQRLESQRVAKEEAFDRRQERRRVVGRIRAELRLSGVGGPDEWFDRALGAVLDYLRTPDGGWPETSQRWRELVDILWTRSVESRSAASALAERAAEIVLRHLPGEAHPSRREEVVS